MTFWHIEQRDARDPLDCWKANLLLTDTPAPGAVPNWDILEGLKAWVPKVEKALVHTHFCVHLPKTTWRDHHHYPMRHPGEWIELYTKPGDIVVDPFCGSSVVGLFALRLGRSFIGTDIDRVRIEESFETLTKGESLEESRWQDLPRNPPTDQ